MAESRKRRETTATTILDLHADLLLEIIKRLDRKSLQAITLVSPRFVPLTNSVITELTFRDLHLLTRDTLNKILGRFPSVKVINLNKSASIAEALTAISGSELNIEALRIYGCPSYPDNCTVHRLNLWQGKLLNVKSLKLEWFVDQDRMVWVHRMVQFIKLFPSVDDLDLSSGGRWDETGIRMLAKSFPNLRRINLSQNNFITNASLQFLATSCMNLEHVCLDVFKGWTMGADPEGVILCIQRLSNLRSLRLRGFFRNIVHEEFQRLANVVGSLKYLTHLAICDDMVDDGYLKAFVRFRLPLTSLEIYGVGVALRGFYTMKGLSVLFSASRSLTNLDVRLPQFDLGNQDREMSQLVKLLPHLRCIQIHTLCWFHETLFSLIDNCHKLQSITINGGWGKCGSGFRVTRRRKRNCNIEFIRIRPRLGKSFRTALISSCPLLKQLEFF